MKKKKQDKQGKSKEGVSDLQKFKTDGGVVRLSDKLIELLRKKGIKKDGRILIFKYMPLINFLKSFYGNYIYLSSPKKWEDPFETQYKEWLKKQCKSNSKMLDYEVFAACFASSLESEKASWNEYLVHGADVIRVAIDYNKFLEEVNGKCKNMHDGTLYLSKMDYRGRKYILTPKKINNATSGNGGDQDKDLYINNFSLKIDSYKFENEIRLNLILKTKEEKEVEKFYLLKEIDWKKFIDHITLPPYRESEEHKYEYLRNVLEAIINNEKELKSKDNLYQSNVYEVKKEVESPLP